MRYCLIYNAAWISFVENGHWDVDICRVCVLAKNMVLTTPPSGRFQRDDVCDAEPQVPSDVV